MIKQTKLAHSRLPVSLAIGVCLLGIACDTQERVNRLEKQGQELQTAAKRNSTVTDYDLQSKCANDSKQWFREHWQRDKTTQLLDYTNHYNKAQNRCFVLVEYHYGSATSWTNHVSLWDIYENSQYGNFSEAHMVYLKGNRNENRVLNCQVRDENCKTSEEFNNLVRPYLTD